MFLSPTRNPFQVLIIERKPHLNGPQWKFAGSFYYALVVLALIGYGHSTPNTPLGKGTEQLLCRATEHWDKCLDLGGWNLRYSESSY